MGKRRGGGGFLGGFGGARGGGGRGGEGVDVDITVIALHPWDWDNVLELHVT